MAFQTDKQQTAQRPKPPGQLSRTRRSLAIAGRHGRVLWSISGPAAVILRADVQHYR